MTRAEIFVKNAKSTHGHRSAMSKSASCDLNKNCTVLRCMICATILNADVQNEYFLLLINFNSKAMNL